MAHPEQARSSVAPPEHRRLSASDLVALARGTACFTALNIALALLIGRGLIREAAGAAGPIGWAFVHFALFGQVGAISLLVGVGAVCIARFTGSRALAIGFASACFATFHILLAIDGIVHRMFHFHINGLAYNVLTTPGGFASLRLSTADQGLFIVAIAALPAIEYLLLRSLIGRFAGRASMPALLWRPWLGLVATVLAVGMVDRTLYAAADLAGNTAIMRLARLVPLYQPTTVKRLARTLGLSEPDRQQPIMHANDGSSLRYPRAPLMTEQPGERPNIVWVVLDSWRHDALTSDVTPAIMEFSRDATVFEAHFATGNATRFGIFGMLYGLHGAYWHPMLAEQRGPLLLTRLRELGYEFRIIAPSPLTFPEFRRTAFVEVGEGILDRLPGRDLVERHAAAADAFDRFVTNEQQEPFFAFIFFDATHAPYDFPQDEAHFRPYARSVNYATMSLQAERDGIVNRYRNSLRYLDGLTGRILAALARTGLDERTVVLVTGDHGEEFGEHGFWGHNSAFTPEQIRVPLVIRFPGRAPDRVSWRTSHQDLVPTFMEMLGVRNPPSDYSNGQSLFTNRRDAKIVACGWDDCAWILDDSYVVFGTSTHRRWGMDVLDDTYRAHAHAEAMLAGHAEELVELAGEFSVFLRK